jgi:hypothetical protein
MNFSDFLTNHGKKVTRDHFIHLIQVSKTDGAFTKEKLELLHKKGKKFGLTDPEIDKLIESENHHCYQPPYSVEDKFDHLYNVAEIILADDVVTESEMKMLRRFAIEAGFGDKILDDLLNLVIEGVKKGEDEEVLLKTFKKKMF